MLSWLSLNLLPSCWGSSPAPVIPIQLRPGGTGEIHTAHFVMRIATCFMYRIMPADDSQGFVGHMYSVGICTNAARLDSFSFLLFCFANSSLLDLPGSGAR